ncbi:MAG: sporulation initiation factor Spo0A C-terminal domain-containing protein [Clostridia bacterium]|nr:sporulation initiation factor Spo0A C-terminal domain-containing protein [Clostridia bacterium]
MKNRVDILCAVRDKAISRMLSAELDDGERCTVRLATDGTAALEAARRFAPGILVVDAILPSLDGLALVDRLGAMLREQMPRVIGGAMLPMAEEGFYRRGAVRVVGVPWRREELCGAVVETMREMETYIDWEKAREEHERAARLLRMLGMRQTLRGFDYLSWAAALACEREESLFSIGERLYRPIAERLGTTPQNVERLIRHAVESAMDSIGAVGIYGFFGNTIDPTRGKPTNAQMIGMLAQRIRVEHHAGRDDSEPESLARRR